MREGRAFSRTLWSFRARSARDAADTVTRRATATVVEAATAGGAGLAKAADRAGPVLDRLDDALVPRTGQALEAVVGAAAATSRTVTAGLLRLVLRARLLPGRPGPPPRPRPAGGGAPGPDASASSSPATRESSAVATAEEPSVGRALLERGARIAVLGLVAMIVLSAAAALLPGMDGQRRDGGGTEPTSPAGGAPAGPADAAVVPSVTIGPTSGESMADYVGGADQSLAALAEAAPEADLLAVVSLAGYRTPDGLQALLATYRVTQVFFTVPGSGTVHQAAVRTPVDDVLAALAAQAAESSRRSATTTDPAARARASAQAQTMRGGRSCSCLFAAVVRASAGRLLALRQDPSVRVIDAAPPATLENAVRFIPVPPESW
ncbi:hypothetical protein [Pseudofrankia asymbiotica]|uniref:Uncharacterized protein n=1 Tax=Pseudofrankia asymbiotica TaxID=1834516 RepID=A0A1V2IC64_9ACTN|nr:hypothetical protein [Pseudofrankia asymbiotica]ONH30479.1 hypothetical protein BL253_13375 [Pseudofrankia asymbiotica]